MPLAPPSLLFGVAPPKDIPCVVCGRFENVGCFNIDGQISEAAEGESVGCVFLFSDFSLFLRSPVPYN